MSPQVLLSTGHTGITVSDLHRSIFFYRDLLGCEVSPVVECAGPLFEAITAVPSAVIDVVFVRLPGHIVELLCFRQPDQRARSTLRTCDAGFCHLCLKVADIDNVVSSIQAAGFSPLSGIQTIEDGPAKGMRAVYVRDPDGVVIELVEEPRGVVLEELYWPH